ncbi:MAG: amidohydrolase [Egibacteraceae bacterium]
MDDQPRQPYPGHIARLAARIEADMAAAEPLGSPHDGAPAELRTAVSSAVERRTDDLIALSHEVHAHPEVGFTEHRAVAAVARLLGEHGHDAEVGAFGLPTALRARVGAGHPRVAVIAEYDALPGIGHACGHNVICATAVGAFLALADTAADLGGSVELIGTPAEEGGGGKELIAQAGGFDEIDVAVMAHPSGFDVAEHRWLGVRQVEVVYRGRAAHASLTPFLGVNALDAAVAAYTGIAQLRQHMLPGDRMHGIITDGGQRPNIVPDRAAATFYLRSSEPDTLVELSERADAIFQAAAAASGAAVDVTWDPCPTYLPVRSNHALAARYAANMAARGRRVLPAGIVPLDLAGSTDMGNVSVRVPSIHPFLAISPPEVTIHTPDFAHWAASDLADRGTVDGATALALTAADYLTDAALREAVHDEFDAAGGVVDVDALLATAGRPPPPWRGGPATSPGG